MTERDRGPSQPASAWPQGPHGCRAGAWWLLLAAMLAMGCGGGAAQAPADAALGDTAVWDAGSHDGGDAGLADGGGDALDGTPRPTAGDISFAAVSPLPAGEQLLFNDWLPQPNAVFSLSPDGETVTEVFRAYRVWAMAASGAVDRIAFACGDPLQEEHYGITIGDSIQHTWIYDVATETATVLAYGNLNDECHVFGPGDTILYVCRRYDFTAEGDFSGWRIGRVDLDTEAFTFVTDPPALEFHLSPQPTLDGQALLFGRLELGGGNQTATVVRLELTTGTTQVVRADASRPLLSPDGQRFVFQNHADGRTLYAVDLDGGNLVKVADRVGTSCTYSPDGLELAYLVWDDGHACSHIEVVKVDGSEVSSPRRVRDCSQTGEFITELDWVVGP